ncbi:MAG: GNAT family N-acetyltransferase [Hyphomonadaceae bacterium]|nr:GNAT family N-acetyltransferase [Hyphomonadaceae bacterium]
MIVRDGDFADPKVLDLLREHLAGMHANSPPGSVYALDLSGLQRADISFLALWDGADLLAIGALRELTPHTGEIKSMRTAQAHLRKGAAARLLEHMIVLARTRGYSRLSLETGTGDAFEPALALYRQHGFHNGDAFGDYEASAFNQFLHLELA